MNQENKNMLLQKKMNYVLSSYLDIQTQWIDDADAFFLINFIRSNKNKQVPGFYKYVLQMHTGERLESETLCADLLHYARYCQNHPSPVRIIENKNIIEQ